MSKKEKIRKMRLNSVGDGINPKHGGNEDHATERNNMPAHAPLAGNRDQLDKIIGAKLVDRQELPHADMWNRIEADLKPVATTERKPFSEKVVVRSKLSRNVMWKYAAAIGLLLCVFGVARYTQTHGDLILAESNEIEKKGIEPKIEVVRDQLAVVENAITNRTEQKQITGKYTYANVEHGASSADSANGKSNKDDLTEAVDVVAVDLNSEAKPKQVVDQNNNVERNNSVNHSEPKTDNQQGDRVWAATGRNNTESNYFNRSKRKRSGNGLSTSLFAANLTASDMGSENVSNIKKSPGSSLNMSETSVAGSLTKSKTPQYTAMTTQKTLKHHSPLSAGVDVSWWFNDRFALQSGLSYTYLRSDVDDQGVFNYKTRQDVHYLGIPVAAIFNVVNTSSLDIYARGGFMAEKAVYAAQSRVITGENSSTDVVKMDVEGMQGSLFAGIGAQYSISSTVGLYIEPGMSYYIIASSQPESYRTKNPVVFNLRAGLRFNFR